MPDPTSWATTPTSSRKGSTFHESLIPGLLSKVQGKSSLAKLSSQKPLLFNGNELFTFSMTNELDLLGEADQKSEGGISLASKKIVPLKFEYGARVSDEFMFATLEKQLDILSSFADGFAKKVASALDIAAMHGLNPRTGLESTLIGTNCLDGSIPNTNQVAYVANSVDDKIETAINKVLSSEITPDGIILSHTARQDMAALTTNNAKKYPDFAFGAAPAKLGSMTLDVNTTVTKTQAAAVPHGYVGNFEDYFRWGIAKEIPMQIIEYGSPDGGPDLKRTNEIYIRAEIYMGWAILDPNAFASIVKAAG